MIIQLNIGAPLIKYYCCRTKYILFKWKKNSIISMSKEPETFLRHWFPVPADTFTVHHKPLLQWCFIIIQSFSTDSTLQTSLTRQYHYSWLALVSIRNVKARASLACWHLCHIQWHQTSFRRLCSCQRPDVVCLETDESSIPIHL